MFEFDEAIDLGAVIKVIGVGGGGGNAGGAKGRNGEEKVRARDHADPRPG